MKTRTQILLKKIIKEEVRKALKSRRINEASEGEVELSNGFMLMGPSANLAKVKMLAKKIEDAMEVAAMDAEDEGRSEDGVMDAQAEAMYEFEPMLEKLGFRIEI